MAKTKERIAPPTPAIATFERGDYRAARSMLDERANDSSLEAGQRETARRLLDATRIDRTTLWVGLACVGLFLLVVVATRLTQP